MSGRGRGGSGRAEHPPEERATFVRLAGAITGNIAGAIEDFNAFIAWAPAVGVPEQQIAERKAWVAALQAGRNPFDAATLERLRNQ